MNIPYVQQNADLKGEYVTIVNKVIISIFFGFSFAKTRLPELR